MTRCVFVLTIPDKLDIAQLLQLWDSEDTDQTRKLLQQAKKLKAEIKNHFNQLEK